MVARLAVEGHLEKADCGLLDLRTSPDEIDFVNPAPAVIWSTFIAEAGDPGEVLQLISDYGLSDPYGELRIAPTLAAQYGCFLAQESVTVSAGVSGLLRQLAPLAANRRLLVGDHGYPDSAHWAELSGASVQTFSPQELSSGKLSAQIQKLKPALVVIDHPNIFGDLLEPEILRDLSRAAATAGAIIVVDEAHANYLEASASMVPLAHCLGHVVVLRSLSKGYRMGGLRIGYAVSAPHMCKTIRSAIGPLGASNLALHFAIRLLDEGDVFETLRARTSISKQEATALLTSQGLDVLPGHPNLPWVLVKDERGLTSNRLKGLGILGRRLSGVSDRPSGYVKVAVPLSDIRRSAFRKRLEG